MGWCLRRMRGCLLKSFKSGVSERSDLHRAINHAPGNRHMVFVNDAKNSLHDMSFCPTQTNFESEKVAKDYAALLALVEVQGMMPLENKLPEPYRSVWKEVITSKKNKETKDGKKSGVTEGAKKEAPTQAPAVPRKLPPAPKDFMFSEDKEEEEEPPEIFSVAPGTLDPTTADWLCVGCNTQNYARLATGQLRTKCFKCGGTKSDACELVQSTQPAKVDKQPAALKNLQSAFGKAQREEEKERLEEKKARTKPHAFKGSHTGAAQLVQRGGRGNRQKKGAIAEEGLGLETVQVPLR